jgi:inositol transport system substrate-binding protein
MILNIIQHQPTNTAPVCRALTVRKIEMKHLIIALAASAILMTSAMAQKIGVTLSAFEHQFLVKVRQAMTEKAKELGVQIQFVEAQGDIGKQLSQIQNFITQKMDAIIVNPVDTTATPKMTALVTEAGIPLVYVNLQPAEETLPKGAAYVGSPEVTSGKLQGEAIAKLLNNKGNVVIMVGELATQAAVLRTEGVEKVVAQHPEMKIVGKQTANWRRNEAIDLMNNGWLPEHQSMRFAQTTTKWRLGQSSPSSRVARIPRKSLSAVLTQPATRSRKWKRATWL